jgi:hypothetical protein
LRVHQCVDASCEETAVARSLLDTAKLMEGSPVALRLMESEALERVTVLTLAALVSAAPAWIR